MYIILKYGKALFKKYVSLYDITFISKILYITVI